MDKYQWENFARYNLHHIWRTYTNGWVFPLFNLPLISFLKKFKKGERLFYLYQKLRFKLSGKPAMPICQYVVTTRCTMNCLHCNTCIPKFTNETHVNITTFAEFKSDIDTLLQAVNSVEVFGFVGGEPLLAKDLAKMITYAASKSKIKHIFVATNCTILPSEELILALKNKKVGVQISDYRNVEDIKGGIKVRYDEYKDILLSNNVRTSPFQEKRGGQTWFTMADMYVDTQSNEKALENYSSCFGLYCNMLHNGYFTQCTLSVYMTHNMELSNGIQNELVYFRGNKSIKELTQDLINFYAKPYSQFCHYCHWENRQYGLPCGEQVE